MNYYEQLKHPRWFARREEIILKANKQCEICGDEGPDFEVHHGVYLKDKMAWEYPDEVLYCLCSACHFNLTELMAVAYYELGRRHLDIYKAINAIRRCAEPRSEEFETEGNQKYKILWRHEYNGNPPLIVKELLKAPLCGIKKL